MNGFVICNVNDDELFWSNKDGWTELSGADTFSFEDTLNLRLPIEGMWCLVS